MVSPTALTCFFCLPGPRLQGTAQQSGQTHFLQRVKKARRRLQTSAAAVDCSSIPVWLHSILKNGDWHDTKCVFQCVLIIKPGECVKKTAQAVKKASFVCESSCRHLHTDTSVFAQTMCVSFWIQEADTDKDFLLSESSIMMLGSLTGTQVLGRTRQIAVNPWSAAGVIHRELETFNLQSGSGCDEELCACLFHTIVFFISASFLPLWDCVLLLLPITLLLSALRHLLATFTFHFAGFSFEAPFCYF